MAPGAWRGLAFVGGCVLLPYNCLLLAQAYFDRHAFPGLKFAFTSMIVYSAALCVGQGVLTAIANKYSVSSRMWVSNIGTAMVCAVMVICTLLTHATIARGLMYVVCLLCAFGLGAMASLMQTALMGLAGTMGPAFSAAVMFGFGVCGLVAFATSLLLEALFAGLPEEVTVMWQSTVLFALCLLYTLASTWMYHGWLCRRVPNVMEALMTLEQQRPGHEAREEARELQSADAAVPRAQSSASSWKSVPSVLRRVAPQAFNVWLVFAVTMTIFPGIVDNWVPQSGSAFSNNLDLLAQILTGTFQVFDVLGRYAAELMAKHVPGGKIWVLAALRLLFVPAFMLGQRSPGSCALWGSDWGRILLVALMAFSNGFTACCAMMVGPGLCEGSAREVAGIAMSFTMVTGIFCGTLLAFLTQL